MSRMTRFAFERLLFSLCIRRDIDKLSEAAVWEDQGAAASQAKKQQLLNTLKLGGLITNWRKSFV